MKNVSFQNAMIHPSNLEHFKKGGKGSENVSGVGFWKLTAE
jgi:hypothetical protein